MGIKRSKWKGVLMKKINYKSLKNKKNEFLPIKIYSRSTIVTPFLIGKNIEIFNGIKFIPVKISEDMIGHKLGEFSFTRKRNFYKKVKNGSKSKF